MQTNRVHIIHLSHCVIFTECLCLQEAELSTWTAFVQRAVDATYNTEVVVDNLHNLVGESNTPTISSPAK